ncbi:hypothetical protein N7462_010890 [Penicillium macrosclerotiorum]|uniref:uncharacterized protein n=1 Tax=Penicillium macrosclerotiorum TaxID=303699 RepID=UPI0025476193|nr:uncharacterized protein N7462_010890 [Penicillium macrosclerotiorum]KAJ5669820.1 hypothetical protein N7462_010890 [Penicillium macrosclerotiorum]
MSFAKSVRRHIQDLSNATELEPHWGYADRAVPCTNDAGSCAYLDAVYSAHDIGMMYTGIIWATIGGILFICAMLRQSHRSTIGSISTLPAADLSGFRKLHVSFAAFVRRYLLPDAVRLVFGRTSRLQVLILAALAGYLLIFSFVGIVYNTWVTPVSGMSGVYNTRSSIGPWADRVGVLAYALTPLSVLLSTRESLLSLITGIPYQSFNFLHRWLGYIIFVQSSLHTIGWCVVELRLYQPQPSVGIEWVTQTYIVWGIVAMILLLLLFVLSTPWGIRLTGYETFRKAHYILAMVFIGACWAHWKQLKCFLLPSLIFWGLDRGVRLARSALLHYHPGEPGVLGFKSLDATITLFPDPEHGDVVRLELENNQEPWEIGQHYYLCFMQGSIWQSHPFTPLNVPFVEEGKVRHSYILRAKKGETKKIIDLAVQGAVSTPVILTGPYGESINRHLTLATNVVCVAGGTGITYVLPVLLNLARQAPSPDRKVELIWVIKHVQNTEWVRDELDLLQSLQKDLHINIRIFATRDTSSESSLGTESQTVVISSHDNHEKTTEISQSSSISKSNRLQGNIPVKMGHGSGDLSRHPDLRSMVEGFVENTIQGPTTVFASGPGGMLSDLRSIVACCNSASKVWAGQERFDVRLVCDDRLEW